MKHINKFDSASEVLNATGIYSPNVSYVGGSSNPDNLVYTDVGDGEEIVFINDNGTVTGIRKVQPQSVKRFSEMSAYDFGLLLEMITAIADYSEFVYQASNYTGDNVPRMYIPDLSSSEWYSMYPEYLNDDYFQLVSILPYFFIYAILIIAMDGWDWDQEKDTVISTDTSWSEFEYTYEGTIGELIDRVCDAVKLFECHDGKFTIIDKTSATPITDALGTTKLFYLDLDLHDCYVYISKFPEDEEEYSHTINDGDEWVDPVDYHIDVEKEIIWYAERISYVNGEDVTDYIELNLFGLNLFNLFYELDDVTGRNKMLVIPYGCEDENGNLQLIGDTLLALYDYRGVTENEEDMILVTCDTVDTEGNVITMFSESSAADASDDKGVVSEEIYLELSRVEFTFENTSVLPTDEINLSVYWETAEVEENYRVTMTYDSENSKFYHDTGYTLSGCLAPEPHSGVILSAVLTITDVTQGIVLREIRFSHGYHYEDVYPVLDVSR
ncbi:MAG: hypothetical protein IJR06_04390 [Paludibacteraceae bacterium]|nr:hypothetical protein [Paludibacteraceae bacterium]